MGLKPKIGRDLAPADDIAGVSNVALISENLWRKHFAGSPSVLGRRALIDGLEREIIGVTKFADPNEELRIPLLEISDVQELRHLDRLARVRAERDADDCWRSMLHAAA